MLIFFDLSCLTRGKTLLCRNILTSALSTFLAIVLFGVWEEEGISTARFRFSPEEKPKPKTPVYRSAAHETTKSTCNLMYKELPYFKIYSNNSARVALLTWFSQLCVPALRQFFLYFC